MQKKRTITIVFSIILFFMFTTTIQAASTYELEFKTKNQKEEEKFDLYLLLPQKYIVFAIKQANLQIDYQGVNTLKDYSIPTIDVEKQNIQDDLYLENEIEYVQILLQKNNKNIYSFSILEDYPYKDMKYRIKNEQRDYIVHIDNFKEEKGKCEIVYNYKKNTVNQPNKIHVPFGVKILLVILIVVIAMGGIAYWKQRR